MNLHKAVLTLTIACLLFLPLAVSTGCTGPPAGSTNQTNTTGGDASNATYADDYSNTTN